MKIQSEELLFNKLFKLAISEWPKSLNLELETQEFAEVIPTDEGYDLVRYKSLPWNKSFDAYVVKGLYELCEEISEKYYDHPKELLLNNLHDKIFDTIWNLARYINHFEIKHLRSEIVQQEFEEILNDGVKNQREDWGQDELRLIKDYFSANYPEKYQ